MGAISLFFLINYKNVPSSDDNHKHNPGEGDNLDDAGKIFFEVKMTKFIYINSFLFYYYYYYCICTIMHKSCFCFMIIFVLHTMQYNFEYDQPINILLVKLEKL